MYQRPKPTPIPNASHMTSHQSLKFAVSGITLMPNGIPKSAPTINIAIATGAVTFQKSIERQPEIDLPPMS